MHFPGPHRTGDGGTEYCNTTTPPNHVGKDYFNSHSRDREDQSLLESYIKATIHTFFPRILSKETAGPFMNNQADKKKDYSLPFSI